MAFCSGCGQALGEGVAFCGKCGTKAGEGLPQKSAVATADKGAVLAHVDEFFHQKQEFSSCKFFEGLYTNVAVSEFGYLGFFRPYLPSVPGRTLWEKLPEQPEYFELFHVSQINCFDIDVVDDREIDLIIQTKDFSDPRHVIPLYKGHFSSAELSSIPFRPPSLYIEYEARQKKEGKGVLRSQGIFNSLLRDVYNNGDPPEDTINELVSSINQIMVAHAEKQTIPAVASQRSAAAEILEFKQLLDAGVITQDEFDVKKRQLLG